MALNKNILLILNILLDKIIGTVEVKSDGIVSMVLDLHIPEFYGKARKLKIPSCLRVQT